MEKERAEIYALRLAVIELLRFSSSSGLDIEASLKQKAAMGKVKPDDAPHLSPDVLVRERLTALIDDTWN